MKFKKSRNKCKCIYINYTHTYYLCTIHHAVIPNGFPPPLSSSGCWLKSSNVRFESPPNTFFHRFWSIWSDLGILFLKILLSSFSTSGHPLGRPQTGSACSGSWRTASAERCSQKSSKPVAIQIEASFCIDFSRFWKN